jgi:KDO2-lipid IV(A) lauroyltransferase
VRDRLEFLVYRVACRLARTLGPVGLSAVGSVLGRAYAVIGSERREILRYNLRYAMPELRPDQRRTLELGVARHFGRASLDVLRLRGLEPAELLEQVTTAGRQHVDAAHGRGRGVLLLSAHLGSWEVAALVAGLVLPQGFSVVNRPLDNPLLDAELERFRAAFGNQSLGKSGVARQILHALRRGGGVGLLIDQRAHKAEGVQVPFFGRPSWTHPILARLAVRTGAPVVPIWGLWDGPGRYTVRFEAPVEAGSGDDETALTARYMRVIEAAIRERPEQWLWYHDRWRHERMGGE